MKKNKKNKKNKRRVETFSRGGTMMALALIEGKADDSSEGGAWS